MSIITRLLIYTLLSFLFGIMNFCLILIIVLKRKNRERQEFLFIAGMAAGDVIYSIGFFLFNCRRLEYFTISNQDDLLVHRSECLRTPAPILLFLGNILVGNMSITNSADRFMATFFPLRYYSKSRFYTLILLAISYGVAIIYLVADMIFVLMNPLLSEEKVNVYCTTNDFLHPNAKTFFNYYQYTCISLSALFYIAIGVSLYKRLHKSSQIPMLSRQNSKKLIRVNTTMGLIMLNTVIFLLIPQILLETPFLFTEVRIFLYLLILFKTAFNFLIFVSRHSELRSFIVGNRSTSQM